MSNSYERPVWSFSRIQGIVENEYRHLTTESGLKVIEFPRQSFLNFLPFSTVNRYYLRGFTA